MKTKFFSVLFVLALLVSLSACEQGSEPAPSVDEQVQTAVAATATAQASKDAEIQEAVAATVTAFPTMTPFPTPTAISQEEYYELTEEELTAMIDEAVNEAVAASETASTTTSQAASDGTMSSEEVYDAAAYAYEAEAAIYYAEELIDIYYDLYGDYADDIVILLEETEELLNTMNQSLEDIDAILVQGAEAASAAAEQLSQTAEAINAHIAESQETRSEFMDNVKTSLEERESHFANFDPTEIAPDLNGTIEQLHDYVDAIKESFADRKISRDEMNRIAQLGANAQASLRANGGPKLQGLGASIDSITRQISRGDWSGAQRSLGGFEASLPARPGRH